MYVGPVCFYKYIKSMSVTASAVGSPAVAAVASVAAAASAVICAV